MSTTMEGIDACAYLTGWSQALVGMTTADIMAIPEEKWTATFGGCTRPANEIMADTINLLNWTTGALKGEPGSGGDEYNKELVNELATRDAAIAKLKESAGEFAAALNGASPEALTTVVTPPWNMPAPLYMLAQIAVSHIWYHDGQLNYIQTLLGDDKVHWMDA